MRRTPVLLLVVALALSALTACGGSDEPTLSELSAKQLLARSKAAVKSADYVTVKGAIKQDKATTALDLSYGPSGAQGSMGLNGSELQILRVGDKTWFKPTKRFWRSQLHASAAAVVKKVAGRWIVADSNSSFSSLVQLGQRDFVTQQLLDPSGSVKKGKSRTVDGIRCFTLESTSGLLYLSRKDARPVQITGKDSTTQGSARFDYTKKAAPRAPAAKDTVDLAQLG